MKFAKEGYRVAVVPAVLGFVCWPLIGWWAAAAWWVAATLALLFFRDPERVPPADPEAIISPADGRICVVDTNCKPHRFDDACTVKISVFMSPLDVHINRMPIDGTMARIEHRAGKFSAAYSDEASEVNESNSMLVRANRGFDLVMVQIAGWLARRIVCHVDEGAKLSCSDRYGLIMFGSRVDMFLPANAVPAVQVGDRVSAGVTVLARVGDAA